MSDRSGDRDQGRSAPQEQAPQRSGNLVVRTLPARPVPRRTRVAVALRARVPELARHPAVVGAASAAATVGTGVAVNLVRTALRSGGWLPDRGATPPSVGIQLVHIHVVHHVVHHAARPALPPGPPVS